MLLASYASLLCLLLKGFQTTEATTSNDSPFRRLAPNNADFAFRVFKNLTTLNPNKDVLISPISISMTLSMLTLGAGSYSSSELFKSLGFDFFGEVPEFDIHKSFQELYTLLRMSDSSLKMIMGSTLFHNETLNIWKVFPVHARHYYGLQDVTLDFQASTKPSSQVNEYLKKETQGGSSDLFLEIESPDTLILINYVFFSGTWEKAFNPEDTRMEDFFLNEKTVVKVPMMFQFNEIKYLYDSELKCMLVKLEYMGNGAAFFILPDNKNTDMIIQSLSRDRLAKWDMSLVTSSKVNLYIPKLTLSGTNDLGEILKALGLEDLKTNHTDASKNMNAVQKLTDMIYKANLQLSEAGKEAPNTFSYIEGRKAPEIRFNRPFIIMAFDHTSWSSVFLGKIINPQNHMAIGSHDAH
ncbi:corticosteroid-binding globulin-like [Sorex fumeus]|uniref:corticosteroid-binding globulin-like n=1 Tax=Sorex fumeus TaxID=62283 RepID=UPI0024AD968B|nr:corticosteroid-binding globulin-like [Sorex fumeus]